MKNKLIISSIVIFHYIVALGLLSAPFICLVYQPWYIALIAYTFVVRVVFSPVICPISLLEMYFERKAGYPEHSKFIKSWVLNYKESWKNLYEA